MKKGVLVLLSVLGFTLSGWTQELVERIDVVGNDRITRDTVMYYLTSL